MMRLARNKEEYIVKDVVYDLFLVQQTQYIFIGLALIDEAKHICYRQQESFEGRGESQRLSLSLV